MIKVLGHGNRIAVTNPVTGEETIMINVIFVEEGRSGGNVHMSESTEFLKQVTGLDIGLDNLRTHTHPVKEEFINDFPIGKVMEGHINRLMASSPQMRQQIGVPPRIIDGLLTYFKTWLASAPEDDQDIRDRKASMSDDMASKATIQGTTVKVLEARPRPGLIDPGLNL